MAELIVQHLEVRYGDLVGVADVTLRVLRGQIVALLGSNGAGKTTTLNTIAGLVRASRRRIVWRDEEISGQAAYAIVSKGASTPCFHASPNAAASWPAPCPAASGRCWRSAGRS